MPIYSAEAIFLFDVQLTLKPLRLLRRSAPPNDKKKGLLIIQQALSLHHAIAIPTPALPFQLLA